MKRAHGICGSRAAAFIAAALLVGIAAPGQAAIKASSSAYLKQLHTQAHELRLAQRPEWHRLLHIEATGPHARDSEISDPLFFLAADGRDNPHAELDATLTAFFSAAKVADEPTQCRFHARYEWLKRQLHFSADHLKPQACPKLDAWLQAIDPGRVYVVFASNDLDAPASMFGHTLLRIDQDKRRPGERYLAYSVNYHARTGKANAVGYAVRGLTGGYTGYYSVLPYYDKIREYQGFQHRDLWEYPLRIDAQQKKMLLWHLWELRDIGSPYYFFSRNCSYALLTLLNVVVPEDDLTGPFRHGLPLPHAIPTDTVRVLRKAGLLDSPIYHPSRARRLRWRYALLDPAQQTWVRAYIAGKAALPTIAAPEPGTQNSIAEEMEVAHEALFYRFQVGNLPRSVGLPRDHALLVARSHLSAHPTPPPVPVPKISPDEGHGSGRVSVGWRAEEGASAALLRWRPAYHDRLDPAPGYMVGSEIEFLNLGVLVGPHRVTLSDATLLNVQQVGLRDGLFHLWSWQIATGARRYGLDANRAVPHGSLGGYLEGGPGMAWPILDNGQLFVFPIAAIDVNNSVREGYALAGGIRGGLAMQWPRVSTQLQGKWLGTLAGGVVPEWQLRGSIQVAMNHANGLRLQTSYGRQRHTLATVQLLWEHYY